MPTREVVGLSAVTTTIIDTVEKFLGNSGTGQVSFKPDTAPANLSLDIPGGVQINLPGVIDLKYKKTGKQLAVELVQPITGVVRGISVPITKATIDTSKVVVSFGGLVGMIASLTLKDADND